MFETPPPTEESKPEPLAFFDVWTLALTSPTVDTYQKLLAEPGANMLKGTLWVGLCSLIGTTITIFVQNIFGTSVFQQIEQAFAQSGTPVSIPATEFGITYLVCVVPTAAISSIIGLYISSFLLKLVSGMLGGTATTNEIFYLFASFTAPMTLFTGIAAGIPIVNMIFGTAAGLYTIFLQVLAINAANRFGWGKAIGTVLILMAIGFAIGCLLMFCMISLFGAALSGANLQ